MKWTEEQTINFVIEYTKHECLYNINCEEYKNKQIRKDALLKISQTLNIPDFGPREVYLKIRSLKSTFAQEFKKIRKFQNSGTMYVPSLKWFNLLNDALMAVGICRDISFLQDMDFKEVQHTEDDAINGSDNDTNTNHGGNIQEVNSPTTYNDFKKKPKKRLLRQYNNSLCKVQNIARTVHMPSEQSENEFDIFGRSIAAQLKKMPLETAIEAQMFMQNYLSEMRLRAFRRTQYRPPSSSSAHSNCNVEQPSISPNTNPEPASQSPTCHTEEPTKINDNNDVKSWNQNSENVTNITVDLIPQAWYSGKND